MAPVEPAVQMSSYGLDESPIFLPLALSFLSPSIVSGDFFIVVLLKHATCVDISHGA